MPSEKFYEDLPEIQIDSLVADWGTVGLIYKGSLKQLVRHLRNSISHGHLSVSHELMFEFLNRESVVVFNHLNLHRFCQALAYWCLTKDVALTTL